MPALRIVKDRETLQRATARESADSSLGKRKLPATSPAHQPAITPKESIAGSFAAPHDSYQLGESLQKASPVEGTRLAAAAAPGGLGNCLIRWPKLRPTELRRSGDER